MGRSLAQWAETQNLKLKEKAIVGYIALILDLGPADIVLAFSRAANESNFFHAPATLREFSGRAVTGDLIRCSARRCSSAIFSVIPCDCRLWTYHRLPRNNSRAKSA
jgi:hypothetical protein